MAQKSTARGFLRSGPLRDALDGLRSSDLILMPFDLNGIEALLVDASRAHLHWDRSPGESPSWTSAMWATMAAVERSGAGAMFTGTAGHPDEER